MQYVSGKTVQMSQQQVIERVLAAIPLLFGAHQLVNRFSPSKESTHGLAL